MSIPTWGVLFIVVGLIVYAYLLGSARMDELERLLEEERNRELDRAVPVWSRLPLYDWHERGDFS